MLKKSLIFFLIINIILINSYGFCCCLEDHSEKTEQALSKEDHDHSHFHNITDHSSVHSFIDTSSKLHLSISYSNKILSLYSYDFSEYDNILAWNPAFFSKLKEFLFYPAPRIYLSKSSFLI